MQAICENLKTMKLVFASNNAHKLQEVRNILANQVEILSLQDIGFLDEIAETGETLEANSLLKATTVWQWITQHPLKGIDGVLADDTGLEIDALQGAPGVYSARWAGEPADDARNREKALRELQGVTQRTARFRTVITWVKADQTIQVDGIVNGKIAQEEKGVGGFGYDALFVPDGYEETFAMLPLEKKNTISHRARALTALHDILK